MSTMAKKCINSCKNKHQIEIKNRIEIAVQYQSIIAYNNNLRYQCFIHKKYEEDLI